MCCEKFFNRRIEKFAFKLYKARGDSPGSEKDDWLKAEGLVKGSFLFCLHAFLSRFKRPIIAIIILGIITFLLGILAVGLPDKFLVKQQCVIEPGIRPMVEIEITKIDIIKKELSAVELPALRCAFDCKLLNYGKAPAYIKSVEFFLKDIELEEFSAAPLSPRDGQRQRTSLELSNGVRKAFVWGPVIDIVSVEMIMRVHLLDKDVHSKKSVFWKKKDKEIVDEFKRHIQPFSIIAQVEYYAAEDKEMEKPYYYSVQYKVDRRVNCFYYKSAKEKWLEVSDLGVVSRIP